VFEWDARKAETKVAKHNVSFGDAVTVFLDPNALDGPDLEHSAAEARSRRLGRAGQRARAHGCVHSEEAWQCGNDPDHQRAAREPPRARGVQRQRLISRMSLIRRLINSERCGAWAGLHSVMSRAN
jgi:uncharacterized DUF497 family protein